MTLKKWFAKYGLIGACFVVGSVLLLVALQPFWQFLVSELNLGKSNLIAPVPIEQLQTVTTVVEPQVIEDTLVLQIQPQPEILDESLYYIDLKNWFGENSNLSFNRLDKQYILDIPKLKITNAVVKIGGTDLDNNLIQYAATPFPGERGTAVIFGHSILRQFYDPREKNPQRYMSIFSTIMTLEAGDKIYVTSDGVRFAYEVLYNKEVKPDDEYILAQDESDKFLKLVTCTPEGTYLRRGVVTARLTYE